MKGDFSRFSFANYNNYLEVLKQQGRVSLDSDWNEQAEIWRENFRQLATDIIGPFAIPKSPNRLAADNSKALKVSNYKSQTGGGFDFRVDKGLAYVDGYLIRYENDFTYLSQSDYPEPDPVTDPGDLLVYIETFLKTVNFIDDELIREPALGGADTCLRAKIVGQIRVLPCLNVGDIESALSLLAKVYPTTNLTLTAKIAQSVEQIPFSFGEVETAGGIIPGNLHYRIEIHRGTQNNGGYVEGLKWSDDNAATVASILDVISPDTFLVEESESVMGEFLREGDWVEVSNYRSEINHQGGQMARIKKIENDVSGLAVILDTNIHPLLTRRGDNGGEPSNNHSKPRLRKWSGFVTPLNSKNVLNLGKGIKATVQTKADKPIASPGDYWNFAIRDREYNKKFAPVNSLPHGLNSFRFPLAIIPRKGKKKSGDIIDFRRFIEPLAK